MTDAADKQGPSRRTTLRHPFAVARPEVGDIWAVDRYDRRWQWRATQHGFTNAHALARAREMRRARQPKDGTR